MKKDSYMYCDNRGFQFFSCLWTECAAPLTGVQVCVGSFISKIERCGYAMSSGLFYSQSNLEAADKPPHLLLASNTPRPQLAVFLCLLTSLAHAASVPFRSGIWFVTNSYYKHVLHLWDVWLLGCLHAVLREKKVVASLWKNIAFQCHNPNLTQIRAGASVTLG